MVLNYYSSRSSLMPTERETGRERTFNVSRSACSVRHRSATRWKSAGNVGREKARDEDIPTDPSSRATPKGANFPPCRPRGRPAAKTGCATPWLGGSWALTMHRSRGQTLAMA